jgi:Ca2+-binding EF-hand superfamily protein
MNMFNLKNISLAAVASLLVTFYASANAPVTTEVASAPKADLTILLTQFDADKNGSLSKAEVAASNNKTLMENFSSIDFNKDGELSKRELESF